MLVAAPTGSGKTVVGEYAAWLALKKGGKTFYTTPIKALSNQKYGDLLGLHGAQNVGLLTGDNSVNGDAPIVVMTTEVLRNMIYEDSSNLHGLRYVVLDEVHYLQNPYRGGVWEEVLIHLPVEVQTVSLSATVSNAEEFAEWLQTLRGRVEVIIEESRPVELRHWYFVSDELLPMFIRTADGSAVPNPRAREFERRRHRGPRGYRAGRGEKRSVRSRIPFRTDVIERLDAEDMLPAIYFIFSRKGCDEAVKACLRENVSLTTPAERKEIIAFAEERVGDIPLDELAVLGYDEWIAGLGRGIAGHHAGMIPAFKETVEALFARGEVKAVFATETLALGINMPARSVVIESLMKYTGERHERMTPGEYTQLAGRAGRRGIDELGHCVVLLQRFLNFDAITTLASTRTYPLRSSFQPSYNMAVNLVRSFDRPEAAHLVNSSFAQFQADREVVREEKRREELDAYLASYREKMECDLGEIQEYRSLKQELDRLQGGSGPRNKTRSDRVRSAMRSLKAGDVIQISTGKRKGRYAVIDVAQGSSEKGLRVLVLSEDRHTLRLAVADLAEPPVAVGKVPVPDGFHSRDARARRQLAQRLSQVKVRRVETPDRSIDRDAVASIQESLDRHPCARCPDLGRHLHFAERTERLAKEVSRLERTIARRAGTLAKRFDSVLEILEELGYVSGWSLTEKGENLTRVYNESDLLVVEAIERGLLSGLDAAEVAGLLSSLVFETRGPEVDRIVELPTRSTARAWREVMKVWRSIRSEEESRGLELTREPDPGFAERAYHWARGASLDEVLGPDDAAGDFVRSVKQLVDLLRQVEEICRDDAISTIVREAIEESHRGVVAYSSLEL